MSLSAKSEPEQLITQNLDIWTAAIKNKATTGRGSNKKQELYGIKKLRQLILELAVRGLLVPQDPNDEPASVLLEKIAAEKECLVKEGKIKKQKTLPKIAEEEKPFNLPRGWSWGRLGDAGLVASSSRVQKKDWQGSGVPFYRAREIVKLSKNGHVDNELFISESLFEELSNRGITPEVNDIMITGVGTIGVPYIVEEDDKFYFKDASVLIFKNYFNLNSAFLRCFMYSPFWVRSVHDGSMGTTVHTLTIVRANSVIVPFPPEAEQPRIVAKVDELMALCDQLEQQTESSLSAHQTLVETLLKALLDAAQSRDDGSSKESAFEQAWQRIADHFDVLFTTEHSIDQLKQTILQLAVMGKLVPQDPNDEPAEIKLGKLREKYSINKKGKRSVVNNEVIDHPFELPAGWTWARFPELGEWGRGKSKHRPRNDPALFKDGKWPLIQTGDVANAGGLITTYSKSYSKFGLEQSKLWPKGTMCITIAANIADSAFLGIEACFPDSVVGLVPDESLEGGEYFEFFIRTAKQNLTDYAPSTAQKNINLGILEQVSIPMPPLEEQKRIVAKAEKLLALCDSIKTRINESQTTQLHLADAMAEDVLS